MKITVVLFSMEGQALYKWKASAISSQAQGYLVFYEAESGHQVTLHYGQCPVIVTQVNR